MDETEEQKNQQRNSLYEEMKKHDEAYQGGGDSFGKKYKLYVICAILAAAAFVPFMSFSNQLACHLMGTQVVGMTGVITGNKHIKLKVTTDVAYFYRDLSGYDHKGVSRISDNSRRDYVYNRALYVKFLESNPEVSCLPGVYKDLTRSLMFVAMLLGLGIIAYYSVMRKKEEPVEKY